MFSAHHHAVLDDTEGRAEARAQGIAHKGHQGASEEDRNQLLLIGWPSQISSRGTYLVVEGRVLDGHGHVGVGVRHRQVLQFDTLGVCDLRRKWTMIHQRVVRSPDAMFPIMRDSAAMLLLLSSPELPEKQRRED